MTVMHRNRRGQIADSVDLGIVAGRGPPETKTPRRRDLSMLISAARSQLLVVDMQEKLVPIVENRDAVLRNTGILVEAAAAVSVPSSVSEQYPKGLGHTVPELAAAGARTFEKVEFSCARNAPLAEHLKSADRPQVVVTGVEAHICVLQTALDLREAGYEVFVVADAIGSRRADSREIALARMQAAGVVAVTTEMVVFEWLETAEAPAFRALSKLIR